MEGLHTNPTQVTGLAVFALAALACMRATRARSRRWLVLAVAQWACFAEVLVGMRFRVHDAVDAVLQAGSAYASRTPWQIGLLALTLVLAAACLRGASLWRRSDPDASRALTATIVAVGLFVIESISLHALDSVMYRQVGPILAIALAWTAAATITFVSALRAARV